MIIIKILIYRPNSSIDFASLSAIQFLSYGIGTSHYLRYCEKFLTFVTFKSIIKRYREFFFRRLSL